MGIYIFDASYLYALLEDDLSSESSQHDFGNDIIPRVVAEGRAMAHPFNLSCVSRVVTTKPYWRDVGTIDAFWSANLDLAATLPDLDIYDPNWPIWTYQRQMPPAKFVPDAFGNNGTMTNTVVSGGCIVSGSQIKNSVLFSGVRIHSFCHILNAVILPDVEIHRNCRLTNVVIDRGCIIPEGMIVGEHSSYDAQRFERTEHGVVLITRDMLEKL